MIPITGTIQISEDDVEVDFIRASGPGGQKVNKTATAAQLRFNVRGCATLPEDVRRRLTALAANRINEDDVLVIDAREHRSQKRNRQAAWDRLADLIRRAAVRPRVRRKTKPSLASRMRRLDAKKKRGD